MRAPVVALLIGLAVSACATDDDPPGPMEPIGPSVTVEAPAPAAAWSPAVIDPIAALIGAGGVCSADRWCWRLPTPHGNSIAVAFSTGPDDLWLAGERGVVLHWDGHRWRDRHLPAPPFAAAQNLHFMAGRGPDDVWAGGNNLLYHWDGQGWTLRHHIPLGVDQEFTDVWAAPNGDVWVTADHGVLFRSIAGRPFVELSTAMNAMFLGIWGARGDDFWIVGRPGVLVRSDGETFTPVPTGTLRTLYSVWGSGSDDVWATGQDGTALHWDGAAWTAITTGTHANLSAIHGRGPDDVWIVGGTGAAGGAALHWDGRALTLTGAPFEHAVYGLTVAGPRAWAVGASGAVFVHDDVTPGWSLITRATAASFTAIWGRSDRGLWAVGPGHIHTASGAGWSRVAVGDPVLGLADLDGLPTAAGIELWAVGQRGRVHHHDGAAWHLSTAPGEPWLSAVWASGPGEALIAGDGGVLYRRVGAAWQPIATGTHRDLLGIWGPSPDRAWIVGAGGTILRWDRAAPATVTVEASPTVDDLRAIGGAPDDPAASPWIASRGRVLRRDLAGTWTAIAIPGALDLTSVAARSADDVRFAGAIGQVFHWNGTTLVAEDSGAASTVTGLWTGPGASTWAVTSSGAVLEQRYMAP